jgi:hypothetical protein
MNAAMRRRRHTARLFGVAPDDVREGTGAR